MGLLPAKLLLISQTKQAVASATLFLFIIFVTVMWQLANKSIGRQRQQNGGFLEGSPARSLYKKAYLSNDAAAWMEVNLTSRPPTVWTHEAFKVAGIHTYIHLQKRRMCKNLSLQTFCKSTTTLFSKAVLFFYFFCFIAPILGQQVNQNFSLRFLKDKKQILLSSFEDFFQE